MKLEIEESDATPFGFPVAHGENHGSCSTWGDHGAYKLRGRPPPSAPPKTALPPQLPKTALCHRCGFRS